MSQSITITTVTANTPVDIYYCDALSANCQFVSSASTFPYTFLVPESASTTDFLIKIIDISGCTIGEFVYITPTPTSSLTPTPTLTPTYTPTTTPVIAGHLIGKNVFTTSAYTCNDTVSSTELYTYISQANLTPVIGVVLYEVSANGTLYNPFSLLNQYIKIKFGNDFYVVKINPIGQITEFVICP